MSFRFYDNMCLSQLCFSGIAILSLLDLVRMQKQLISVLPLIQSEFSRKAIAIVCEELSRLRQDEINDEYEKLNDEFHIFQTDTKWLKLLCEYGIKITIKELMEFRTLNQDQRDARRKVNFSILLFLVFNIFI